MINVPLNLVVEAILRARATVGMPREWIAGCESARNVLTHQIGNMLAERNQDFDRNKFVQGCKIGK